MSHEYIQPSRQIGELDSVVHQLFPTVSTTEFAILTEALSLLRTVGEPLRGGGKLVITGSAVKQILLGTPAGWETPSRLASQLLTNPLVCENGALARIANIGTRDLDIRLSAASMGALHIGYERIQDLLPSSIATIQLIDVSGTSLARIRFASGWIVDLGPLNFCDPGSNHRTYINFPYSEAFSVIFLDDDNRLSTDCVDPREAISDEVPRSFFWTSTFTQMLLMYLRALQNRFWWGEGTLYHGRLLRLLHVFATQEVWNHAIHKTPEIMMHLRLDEINASLILLLLCDPWGFFEHAGRYGYGRFLGASELIAKNFRPVGDRTEYSRSLRDGTLSQGQSGIDIVARSLGISTQQVIELASLSLPRL